MGMDRELIPEGYAMSKPHKQSRWSKICWAIKLFWRWNPTITVVNYSGQWISTREFLPPMFHNVIVWGCPEKGCTHAYQARRWTGYTSGPDRGKYWTWTMPNDRDIGDVTHWMPMPPGESPMNGMMFTKFGATKWEVGKGQDRRKKTGP